MSNNTTTTTVERTGQAPLRFTSVADWSDSNEIQNGNHANRWTKVVIYKTQGGKYIARVSSYTQWQGESDYHKAESFETPAEVIEYLKDDEGHLGRVSQGAIQEACKHDPKFAKSFVVEVD